VAIDQTPIGVVAAQLMDQVEAAMADEGSIGAVFLVVEVSTPDGQSTVFSRSNEARIHIQLGLVDVAREMLIHGITGPPGS